MKNNTISWGYSSRISYLWGAPSGLITTRSLGWWRPAVDSPVAPNDVHVITCFKLVNLRKQHHLITMLHLFMFVFVHMMNVPIPRKTRQDRRYRGHLEILSIMLLADHRLIPYFFPNPFVHRTAIAFWQQPLPLLLQVSVSIFMHRRGWPIWSFAENVGKWGSTSKHIKTLGVKKMVPDWQQKQKFGCCSKSLGNLGKADQKISSGTCLWVDYATRNLCFTGADYSDRREEDQPENWEERLCCGPLI